MTSTDQRTASASNLFDVNRWFPSSYHRGPNWLVWLGISSSFIAIFIKLWTPISINRIPETLYTLPFFYILIRHFRWLIKDRIIQLFIVALFWPVIAFGIHYLQDPETALKYQKLDNLARLFLFVPIAWWLGGHARTLGLYLTTAFAGLLVACLLDPNLPATLKALVSGRRVDFNILNAQHVALYFSIALIGILSVASPVLTSTKSLKDAWKPLFWGLSLVICIVIILGTQTRAAWLALTICGGLWVIHMAWQYRHKKPGVKFVASVLVLTALSGLAGYQFSDTVVKRLQAEHKTLTHLVNADWESIPYTSIGVRVNTWIEATRWIAERPITGWGGNVRKDAIQQTERFPDWVKNQIGHFHNSYIEFTLAYGLLGLLVIIWTFVYLLQSSVSPSIALASWAKHFSFYSITLFLIMNLLESYFFFWSGVYVITIILVVPYSGLIRQHSEDTISV